MNFKKKVRISFLICTLSFLIITCKKNNIDKTGAEKPVEEQVDLSTKVTASVSGFITNESDAAINGANVKYGNSTTTTDKYGYFEIKDAAVTEKAAFVTVTMNGYFKGIKTFIAEAGKENFCRIKLIPKTNTGTINATNGGDVTLSNGLSISFPANGIMDAITKTAYTGTVNVASFWIDPTSNDLDKLMPGDLRGINENNSLKALTTFGMAAVELTGSSGELLQVAEGKKASITMTIPAAILANAPATIPLWYFDETIGLWKEEGSAIKTGNNYVGDVKHFSFWNCDFPSITALFNCTIVDIDNNPVRYVKVRITDINDPSISNHGFTNENGYVSGNIPGNKNLLLEILGEDCSIVSIPFSSAVTTAGQVISLAKIVLPQANIATLSVTVFNCNNEPVAHAKITIKHNNQFFQYPVNNDGTFSVRELICGNSSTIFFIAEDIDALKQSFPVYIDLEPGNNTHNFQACDVPTAEFINYTIDGVPYSYSAPSCIVGGSNSSLQYLSIGAYPTNNTAGPYVDIVDSTPGVAGTRPLYGFCPSQPQLQCNSSQVNPITVYLTEYGPVGEFVSGYFEGDFNNPNSGVHHVSCSFRVRTH